MEIGTYYKISNELKEIIKRLKENSDTIHFSERFKLYNELYELIFSNNDPDKIIEIKRIFKMDNNSRLFTENESIAMIFDKYEERYVIKNNNELYPMFKEQIFIDTSDVKRLVTNKKQEKLDRLKQKYNNIIANKTKLEEEAECISTQILKIEENIF